MYISIESAQKKKKSVMKTVAGSKLDQGVPVFFFIIDRFMAKTLFLCILVQSEKFLDLGTLT